MSTTTIRRNLTNRRVRVQCLDCCAGEPKAVTWCPCSGVDSTRCEFWLFRFGMTPAKAKRRYGKHAITPELMPPAGTDLDDLPENIRDYQADGEQAAGGQEAPQPHVDVQQAARTRVAEALTGWEPVS